MKSPDTHVVICGHAKHGKSTLAGRLMYEFGSVDDHTLNELRSEAQRRGKDFNEFSLLFLRRRGATGQDAQIDPSRTILPDRGIVKLPDGRILSLIDTPGHKEFRGNTIYGIFMGDVAVLLVEVLKGIESGTADIRRMLASLDVPIAAVFVTKMDAVGYSREQYDDLVEEIQDLPDTKGVPIVPVSAITGAGFRSHQPEMSWYTGPSAIAVLASIEPAEQQLEKYSPRFVVDGPHEIFSPHGIGTVLVGPLETGSIRTGDQLVMEPASTLSEKAISAKVRTIQRAKDVMGTADELDSVSARAVVALGVPTLSHADANQYLKRGGVLGAPQGRPKVASTIDAEVLFFEPARVYAGKSFVLHANGSQSRASILSIKGAEGEVAVGERSRATIALEHPLCMEDDPVYRRLTLFILRDHNQVVACGRALRVSYSAGPPETPATLR